MEMELGGGGGEMMKRPPLINELLIQGKDFTNQLKEHLEKPIPSSPAAADADEETRRSLLLCEQSLLVDKILSSYEKALSLLQLNYNNNNTITIISSHQPPPPPLSSSSNSSAASGHDEIPTTHHHHNNINPSCNTNIFKKRKTKGINKYWSEQVVMKRKVCTAEAGDGYSWRKYGQKNILGANHPRAYYRCTHRNVQGCLATKQIQRSDEDTSVFEVTYKGRHTCLIQATQLSKALLSEKNSNQQEEEDSKPTHKMFIERVYSFKANNKSEEKGLFPNNSFSFASTPIETEKLEKLFYLGCDSTTFHYDNLQNSDSDVSAEMMKSTPNSSTNSPLVVDWEFSLDREDFDGNFYFEAEMFN